MEAGSRKVCIPIRTPASYPGPISLGSWKLLAARLLTGLAFSSSSLYTVVYSGPRPGGVKSPSGGLSAPVETDLKGASSSGCAATVDHSGVAFRLGGIFGGDPRQNFHGGLDSSQSPGPVLIHA